LEHLEFSEELSGKVWSNRSLKNVEGFKPGVVVYASDFSWETPDSNPWPDGMTGVTFVKCHLHNLVIPPDNTTIECFAVRYKAQNDGNDWLIDDKDAPTLPINHKVFTKFGLPMPKPEDIPVKKAAEPVNLVEVAKVEKAALDAAAIEEAK